MRLAFICPPISWRSEVTQRRLNHGLMSAISSGRNFRASNPQLLWPVRGTHTTTAELFDDVVVRGGSSDHRGQILRGFFRGPLADFVVGQAKNNHLSRPPMASTRIFERMGMVVLYVFRPHTICTQWLSCRSNFLT